MKMRSSSPKKSSELRLLRKLVREHPTWRQSPPHREMVFRMAGRILKRPFVEQEVFCE